MPQFVSQMTKEEMEIESKKATLDGMKDLMKSFKELEELDSLYPFEELELLFQH